LFSEAAHIDLRGAVCLVKETASASAPKAQIDLRVRSRRYGDTRVRQGLGERAIVEAKWSRFRLSRARTAAAERLSDLRRIRKRGRWAKAIPALSVGQPQEGRRACCPLVGVLVACRGRWELKLFRGGRGRAEHVLGGRIRVRPSGGARRKAAASRGTLQQAQQEVPALQSGEWSDPESDESEESDSEESDSSGDGSDSHDGYSTDSD